MKGEAEYYPKTNGYEGNEERGKRNEEVGIRLCEGESRPHHSPTRPVSPDPKMNRILLLWGCTDA